MTVLTTVMSSLRCQRYLSNLTLSQSLHRLSEGFTLFVVYINYHVKTSISYVPYPNSYLTMELFILFGGFYALYVVGNAIAATLDYQAVNKTRRYK